MLMDMACTSILTDTATINRVLMVYGLVSTLSTHTTASILSDLQNIGIVKNEFIVGLKPSTHSTSLVEELSRLVKQTDPHAVIIHTYYIGTFTGFAFKGNIKASSALRQHSGVDEVTSNVQVTLEDSPNDVVIERVDKDSGLPYNAWGLARICSTKQLRGNGEMRYKFEARSGEGIYAYIIDTVVDVNHTEFEGRATFGINAVNESTTFPAELLRHENMEHGTHVAGIVASKTYGVAKKTNVISVNVAQWDDAQNRSMVELDDVMEALEWVRNQHEKRKSKDKRAKSVINISLGYGLNVNFEKSLNAVVDSGITAVVAVGNNGKDACESFTSVGNSKVISVACSDISDQFCTFSNYGKCVDIIAPGLQIPSTLPGNKIGVKNGTSMSAPHVTGVIARYLANDDLSSLPEQVKNWLLSSSLKNQIHFGDKENLGTPNRLVYMQPDEGHHATADPTIAIVLVVLIVVFIVGMVTCTLLKRMNMMPCAKKSDYSIF